jgi:predicted nucleic-acid-binding protein
VLWNLSVGKKFLKEEMAFVFNDKIYKVEDSYTIDVKVLYRGKEMKLTLIKRINSTMIDITGFVHQMIFDDFKIFFKEIYEDFADKSKITGADSLSVKEFIKINKRLPSHYFFDFRHITGELATEKFKESYFYKMHILYDTELEKIFNKKR